MNCKKISGIIFLWVVISFCSLAAGHNTERPFYNYGEDFLTADQPETWLIYNPVEKVFLPADAEQDSAYHALYRFVNTESSLLSSGFRITGNPDQALFIDNKLFKVFNYKDTLTVRAEQWNGDILLGLYNKKGRSRKPYFSSFQDSSAIDHKVTNSGNARDATVLDLTKRAGTVSVNEKLVIVFFLLLFIVVFVKNQFPERFLNLYIPLLTKRDSTRDESAQVSFFSMDSFVFIIINSLIGGFLMSIFNADIWWFEFFGENTGNLLGMLYYAVLIFGIFLVKFYINLITGAVFALNKLAKTNYNDFMKFAFWFISVVFLVGFLKLLNYPVPYTETVIWAGSIMYILMVLRIFFNLFSQASFRKLHLFYYLCISEIVPFLYLIALINNPGL